MNIQDLKQDEKGERLNLGKSFEWIINEMDYDDFKTLTTLRMWNRMGKYVFAYHYMIDEEHDTPETRKDYLKYYMYKLVQNVSDENCEL